jgi:hypothetical protein
MALRRRGVARNEASPLGPLTEHLKVLSKCNALSPLGDIQSQSPAVSAGGGTAFDALVSFV